MQPGTLVSAAATCLIVAGSLAMLDKSGSSRPGLYAFMPSGTEQESADNTAIRILQLDFMGTPLGTMTSRDKDLFYFEALSFAKMTEVEADRSSKTFSQKVADAGPVSVLHVYGPHDTAWVFQRAMGTGDACSEQAVEYIGMIMHLAGSNHLAIGCQGSGMPQVTDCQALQDDGKPHSGDVSRVTYVDSKDTWLLSCHRVEQADPLGIT